MSRRRTASGILTTGALVLAGSFVATPAEAAVNVYTTPGDHYVNGRRWHTTCEAYGGTIERCRTDIWGSSRSTSGALYNGWLFNNLTYLPAPRSAWGDHKFVTTGEFESSGRLWRTECDTATTGKNACRSYLWTTVASWTGSVWVNQQMWVLNHIVLLEPDTAKPEVPADATVSITSARHVEYPNALHMFLAPITVTGTTTGAAAGTPVALELRSSSGKVLSKATGAVASGGTWSGSLAATFQGAGQVVATIGDGVATATSAVTINATSLTITGAAQVDPINAFTVSGVMTPAVAGSRVTVEAKVGEGWNTVGTTTVDAAGAWRAVITHNSGRLGAITLRAWAATPWGSVLTSPERVVQRAAMLNAAVTPTTAAEVASTYRAGCPIGPANLRTIRMNYLGYDGLVHRGEMVVRDFLSDEVINVFSTSLTAGFPFKQMRNPNVWSGSDPSMMAANNTSAFNCRKVVGNPYALSPHSYGIAVDINPVENPYRDPSGKWWPSTAYVKRTPVVKGMLTSTSAPVTAFKANGYSWYSGWDWQHFQYVGGTQSPTTTALGTAATPATSSGDLTAAALAVPLGWTTVAATVTTEDGLAPNGSWTHAVDPAEKSIAMLTVGSSQVDDSLPMPVRALEGTLQRSGKPGVSVALEFRNATEARVWFAAWQSRAKAATELTTLRATSTQWMGQRSAERRWSEAAEVNGTMVRFVAMDATLGVAELQSVANQLG